METWCLHPGVAPVELIKKCSGINIYLFMYYYLVIDVPVAMKDFFAFSLNVINI